MVVSKFPKSPKQPKRLKPPPPAVLDPYVPESIEATLLKYVPLIKVALEELSKRFVQVEPIGPFIGVYKVTGGEVPGAAVACRAGGEDVLFLSRDGRGMTWIPVGSFVVDPQTILTVDQVIPKPAAKS